MKKYYEMFKKYFPFINREDGKHLDIICNDNNEFFEEKVDNKLVGFAIVNQNTILLLIVSEDYRNQGIGSKLLDKCEKSILSKGYDKVILGVGFDYLMPGVPTSEKVVPSVHENLDSLVNDVASNFFKRRGYIHSWGECNCFDMRMSLSKFIKEENSIGDTINGIYYRWATIDDLDGIIECSDNACQYQDEKFSRYYRNLDLYDINNNQRVLVAVKNNKIVGTLIVSIETEGKDLGSVGCTCVSFNETHQGIGTNLVRLGTKYLKDIGLSNACLSYTYTGLDKLYGDSGYEISTYYFMGEKHTK